MEKSNLKLGIVLLISFLSIPVVISFSMLRDTKKSAENFFSEKDKDENANTIKYQTMLVAVRNQCVGKNAQGVDCAQLAIDYSDIGENEIAALIVNLYSKNNIDSKNDENLSKWSKVLVRVGQADKSLQLLNEALENRPGNKKILAERSNVFYYLKRFDKAIEDLAHALIQDPDDEEVFGNIINYLKEAGEIKGSEYLEKNKVALQKAIRNPEYAAKILNFLVKRAPGSTSKSESK